jgi:hypothetical protein
MNVRFEVVTAVTMKITVFFIFFIISRVGLSPLGTAATSSLLYQPQMIDEGDCGANGGMQIGRSLDTFWSNLLSPSSGQKNNLPVSYPRRRQSTYKGGLENISQGETL